MPLYQIQYVAGSLYVEGVFTDDTWEAIGGRINPSAWNLYEVSTAPSSFWHEKLEPGRYPEEYREALERANVWGIERISRVEAMQIRFYLGKHNTFEYPPYSQLVAAATQLEQLK